MSRYHEIAACAAAYTKAQEQHEHDDLDSADEIIAAREDGWQLHPDTVSSVLERLHQRAGCLLCGCTTSGTPQPASPPGQEYR